MKKIKLLVVSDDIRYFTGVGIQCEKLLRGLHKKGIYDIVEIAGSLIPQSNEPVIYHGIKLYPISDGYGNPGVFREIFAREKPDIVLTFSDPRFFSYLYVLDNEIRKFSKLISYHTWDSDPFPNFNLPWYSACDEVVLISNFSYNLMKSHGVPCHCIPHGIDPTEFYPLSSQQVQIERQKIFKQAKNPDLDFIILWNNRNIPRKRAADVINIFREFSKTHENSLLFMHTQPNDPEGTNLFSIIDDINVTDAPIMLSTSNQPSNVLNALYNCADVTLNIAFNEGFGLCISESLCAGTPVICTRTGGMTEQASKKIHHEEFKDPVTGNVYPEYDEIQEFGKVLHPSVRSLYGNPQFPYIYGDYVGDHDVIRALDFAYHNSLDWKQKGLAGRDHIIENFHTDTTIDNWHKLLQQTMGNPSTYRKWKFL